MNGGPVSRVEVIADAPDLLFVALEGKDGIDFPFEYRVSLCSQNTSTNISALVGTPITVSAQGDGWRHFSGLVAEMGIGEWKDGYQHYHAIVRPALWWLTLKYDNRVFQNLSTLDIIDLVLGEHGVTDVEKRLADSYEPREYCVQFGESDFTFLSRLMEDEGIFYHFEHSQDRHVLVLTDSLDMLQPNPDHSSISFQADTNTSFDGKQVVTRWESRAHAVSGVWSQSDFDFTRPKADLSTRSHNHPPTDKNALERYHYPGGYTDITKGDLIAARRLTASQAEHRRATARGTALALHGGRSFDLQSHPREAENSGYAVISAQYYLWDGQYQSGLPDVEIPGGVDGWLYGFHAVWECQPLTQPYLPSRKTAWPEMGGPQTATVVGPEGQEIFTDQYGRVKIQFHWDRWGSYNEDSSCFVRVSSAWAGQGWGFVQIPRIGQEVIVDFLEGDPDRPIVTGRVYNGDNPLPYGLPDNATQSGWKSNSSPGGGGWNELRFEDKAGEEHVYFQAEKDHIELIKNDETRNILHNFEENVYYYAKQWVGIDRDEKVGSDKTTKIGRDQTNHIMRHHSETVDKNRTLHVGGDEEISVSGDSNETIFGRNMQSVRKDRARFVGLKEAVTVGADQVVAVGKDRSIGVAGKQFHEITKDDDTVVKGSQTLSVSEKQHTRVEDERWVYVEKKEAHQVGDDFMLTSGKNILIEAAESITLKCGKSEMIMHEDGTFTLDGKDVSIDGNGKVNITAKGDLTMKGSKINQN